MNQAIRHWIEANYQPWRRSSQKSVLGGTIGSAGSQRLNRDVWSYFEGQGVSLQGRHIEEVLEKELLDVFQTVSRWLTENERQTVEARAAFGIALTYAPNACAMRCLGGYAILFDLSLDPVLISAMELWYAALTGHASITRETFPLAFNTPIVSIFFRSADFWSPIPEEAFPHRELVNRSVWLLSVFLVGHELGHIVLQHLEKASVRHAILERNGEREPAHLLKPAHEDEHAADAFAVDLMFKGEFQGLVLPGFDREQYWNSTYSTLAWLFSVLTGIELIARRLGLALPDTHPPASARWERIAASMRSRIPIVSGTLRLVQRMTAIALQSAESGELPPLHRAASHPSQTRLPPEDAMLALIGAVGPWQIRETLTQHPELLDPGVDEILQDVAVRLDSNARKTHLQRRVIPLLQRCQEIGLEAAFQELLGPNPPPAQAEEFDVPMDQLQAFQTALEHGDVSHLEALRQSYPQLATFMKLPHSVEELVNTHDAASARKVIESHPELLHPYADRSLCDLAAVQGDDAARGKVESFRPFLARCREVGVALAFHEMARFLGE